MKTGIIGGGSTGLLLAAFLAKQHEVTVYVRRNAQRDKLGINGVVLYDTDTSVHVNAKLTRDLKDVEILFVCVKQPQLSNVLSMIQKANLDVPIVFLQNGMTHLALLEEQHRPVLVGVLEHGAYRINDFTVKHTGKGVMKIAAYNCPFSLAEEIHGHLSLPDFPIEVLHDWETLLKEKLVINAVINPLTAIFRIRNGDVLVNPHIRNLAYKLCEEASSALSLDVSDQWVRVCRVAQNTSLNISSMRADIEEKRQTEVQAISGYILEQSKEHSLPYTSFVYESIRALEVKKGIMARK